MLLFFLSDLFLSLTSSGETAKNHAKITHYMVVILYYESPISLKVFCDVIKLMDRYKKYVCMNNGKCYGVKQNIFIVICYNVHHILSICI